MRLSRGPILALLLAALPLGPAMAQAAPPATLTVTGEGRVDTAPDMAVITLGLTTQGPTAAEAMAANSKALADVLARLTAAGVAARDIQTSALTLAPDWTGYGEGETPRIAGYTAQNMVTLRLRALDTLGAVLDAAVRDGANTLNGLSFALADPRPAEDAARTRAVADALARADLIAGAAGLSRGRIVSIVEGGGMAPPQPMFRADAAAAPMAVPVAGGELSVVASVTMVVELAP
jgi:uncharacterized protein YggE